MLRSALPARVARRLTATTFFPRACAAAAASAGQSRARFSAAAVAAATQPLRVAVIGSGNWGRFVAPSSCAALCCCAASLPLRYLLFLCVHWCVCVCVCVCAWCVFVCG
jgi:hypothetical protein